MNALDLLPWTWHPRLWNPNSTMGWPTPIQRKGAGNYRCQLNSLTAEPKEKSIASGLVSRMSSPVYWESPVTGCSPWGSLTSTKAWSLAHSNLSCWTQLSEFTYISKHLQESLWSELLLGSATVAPALGFAPFLGLSRGPGSPRMWVGASPAQGLSMSCLALGSHAQEGLHTHYSHAEVQRSRSEKRFLQFSSSENSLVNSLRLPKC